MKLRTIGERVHGIKFARPALADFTGLTESHRDKFGKTADG